MTVVEEFQRRTGFKLNSQLHAAAARHLGARPPATEDDRTVDLRLAEYITSFKRYLYSQAWVDLLVDRLSTRDGFFDATDKEPVAAQRAETLPLVGGDDESGSRGK